MNQEILAYHRLVTVPMMQGVVDGVIGHFSRVLVQKGIATYEELEQIAKETELAVPGIEQERPAPAAAEALASLESLQAQKSVIDGVPRLVGLDGQPLNSNAEVQLVVPTAG